MASFEDIGARLCAIYQFFTDIGYIKSEHICWPPHDQSTLNAEVCWESGMEDWAVDLLRQLPWPGDGTGAISLFKNSDAVQYSDDDSVRDSRYPWMNTYGDCGGDSGVLSRDIITLSNGHGEGDYSYVLDLTTGMSYMCYIATQRG